MSSHQFNEREAFEREMSKPPFEFCMDRWPDDGAYAWPGGYAAYHTQCAWEGWQARAALPTAAPVGERLTLTAEDVHAAFVKHFPKTRISQAWIGFAAEIAEAIAARASLSAGDAVLAEREACAKLCEEVADDLITAMRGEGETDDEVMTSLVASARVCAKEIRGGYSKKFKPHNAAIDAAMRKDKL